MLDDTLQIVFGNFAFAMLIVALVVALCLRAAQRGPAGPSLAEQTFRWVSLLAVGLAGLFTFVAHVFFAQSTAAHIGWQPSPFQYEVGMADLTVGVLGVLAFRASQGFRLATTVAAVCWLGGDAVGHVRQMVVAHNFAPGNAGSWFWTDVLVPLVMVACVAALWCEKNRPARTASPARRDSDIESGATVGAF